MDLFKNRMQNPDFRSQRRIRWDEVDQSGTLHFANYVRLMEESEYRFLQARGLNVVLEDEKGKIGFPRTSVAIEIIRPLETEELVTVWTKLAENDGIQLTYEFELTDEKQLPVANGRFTVACCRFKNGELPKAILIPDFILNQIPETNND